MRYIIRQHSFVIEKSAEEMDEDREEEKWSKADLLLLQSARLNDPVGALAALGLGANVNCPGYWLGERPIHLAAETGALEAAAVLLAQPNIEVDCLNYLHNSALSLAAEYDHYNVFKLLLQFGANPNTKLGFKMLAIHRLAQMAKYTFLEKIIEYKARVNRRDCFRRTPLFINITSEMDIEITKLLVQSGANVFERTAIGAPLIQVAMHSAHNNRDETVLYLLEKGASVRAGDIKGETVIHWAARMGSMSLIRSLVYDFGADLSQKNYLGQTPYDIAMIFNNRRTMAEINNLTEELFDREVEDFYGISEMR